MRLQISTIMLGLLVSALGCATCGTSTSCDDGFSCDAAMGCVVQESCCDACDGGYEVIYDGPVYVPPPMTSHTMAPAIAAPANVPMSAPIVESQNAPDSLPAAPSLDSIVRPNSVPAPEPTVTVPSATPKASPTKPVKNILPSIISDGT